MEPEDLEPRTKKPAPKNLEVLSVAELEDYITGLEAEIARARQTIAAKKQGRAGADLLFRKP